MIDIFFPAHPATFAITLTFMVVYGTYRILRILMGFVGS